MSLPKVSASYPSAFMDALLRAHSTGEVVIPTLTPAAMRLQFNGLRGALRKEGKGELADQVGFYIEQPTEPGGLGKFIIRLRANSPVVADVEEALKGAAPTISAIEESEASLARILGGLDNA